LRLHDNAALHAALKYGAVAPVFILDPNALNSRYHARAEKRKAFLFNALRSLDAELQQRGSKLIVRAGQPLTELQRLLAETGADAIFAEEDYSPYARARDVALQKQLPLTLMGGVTVHHPSTVQKKDGGPYTVFTPFSKAWKLLPLPAPRDILEAPQQISFPKIGELKSSSIPNSPLLQFSATEAEAHTRLNNFKAAAIFNYSHGRNMLDAEGTSALSPYFRFGLISARAAAAAALEAMRRANNDVAR